jgi:glycosyltransferase involved in cell wall biosynthesis
LGKWWWPILRNYERKFFQRADSILFITPGDRDFAVSNWKIEKERTMIVPVGVGIDHHPTHKTESKDRICREHGIGAGEKILLFNGLLNYKPNLDAVNIILKEINPLLEKQSSFKYKIIICGKGLPAEMNSLKEYQNVIYAGFVDDIETYFKGADIFLNPVQSGGGIKTKMVEAIAYGTTVISTESGAAGIERSVCGEKLVIINDNDWKGFSEMVIQHAGKNISTPPPYYDHYSWEKIIAKVGSFL